MERVVPLQRNGMNQRNGSGMFRLIANKIMNMAMAERAGMNSGTGGTERVEQAI